MTELSLHCGSFSQFPAPREHFEQRGVGSAYETYERLMAKLDSLKESCLRVVGNNDNKAATFRYSLAKQPVVLSIVKIQDSVHLSAFKVDPKTDERELAIYYVSKTDTRGNRHSAIGVSESEVEKKLPKSFRDIEKEQSLADEAQLYLEEIEEQKQTAIKAVGSTCLSA